MADTINVYLSVQTYKIIEDNVKQSGPNPLNLDFKDVMDYITIYAMGTDANGEPIATFPIDVVVGQQVNFTILPGFLNAPHLLTFTGFTSGTSNGDLEISFEAYDPISVTYKGTILQTSPASFLDFSLQSSFSYLTGNEEIQVINFTVDPVLRANQEAEKTIQNQVQIA
jgi:hypothetical protein